MQGHEQQGKGTASSPRDDGPSNLVRSVLAPQQDLAPGGSDAFSQRSRPPPIGIQPLDMDGTKSISPLHLSQPNGTNRSPRERSKTEMPMRPPQLHQLGYGQAPSAATYSHLHERRNTEDGDAGTRGAFGGSSSSGGAPSSGNGNDSIQPVAADSSFSQRSGFGPYSDPANTSNTSGSVGMRSRGPLDSSFTSSMSSYYDSFSLSHARANTTADTTPGFGSLSSRSAFSQASGPSASSYWLSGSASNSAPNFEGSTLAGNSVEVDGQMHSDDRHMFYSTPPRNDFGHLRNQPVSSTPLSDKLQHQLNHARQSSTSTVSIKSEHENDVELRKENAELRKMVEVLAIQLTQVQAAQSPYGVSSAPIPASPTTFSHPPPVPVLDPAVHAALMQNGRPFMPPAMPAQPSVNNSMNQVAMPPPPGTSVGFPAPAPNGNVRGGTGDRWSGSLRPEVALPAPRRREVEALPEQLISQLLHGRGGQDASIVLQQQLKAGTDERTAAIVDAIKSSLLPLCEDKHGNFLVQRAISFDSSIAWQLKGKYVHLALSQFGSHVVQRILDEAEPLKMAVVEELLSEKILDTLSARTAVHIWQKALEITWSTQSFRAKIFQVLNNTLRGKWADTAMQETGSIICQNIFESAEPSEKRECVQEILKRVSDCASNQWGVWVVQHMIDHGEPATKKTVFKRLLEQAVPLTLSQYGQKAIMTALKTNDNAFVVPYIDILCAKDGGSHIPGASGRRSVLIDIACSQQGLNIVTQLLTNVDSVQRERIVATVRRNSVFLKGSKAGLRVHTLCERARAYTGY